MGCCWLAGCGGGSIVSVTGFSSAQELSHPIPSHLFYVSNTHVPFPVPPKSQGPILTRALTEINVGIEEALTRRKSHLKYSKTLSVLSMLLVAGSVAIPWLSPLG